MSLSTDDFFEKLLAFSLKQQETEKEKQTTVSELEKRNSQLRKENEKLVLKLKALEEEQYEQWKYIEELYQITVSEISAVVSPESVSEVKTSVDGTSQNGANRLPPALNVENEAAANEFLTSINETSSAMISTESTPTRQKVTDRNSDGEVWPTGMCITKRKFVKHSFLPK